MQCRWCEIEYLVGAVRTTKIRHARTNRKQLGIYIFGIKSRHWTQIVAKSSASILVTMPGFNSVLQMVFRHVWALQSVNRYTNIYVKSSLCKLKILQQLNSHAKQIIELYYIKSSREISSYCCVCASHYSSSGWKSMTCEKSFLSHARALLSALRGVTSSAVGEASCQ